MRRPKAKTLFLHSIEECHVSAEDFWNSPDIIEASHTMMRDNIGSAGWH